ncbi:carbon-nitrogen hydrolase family protein [Microbacterium sp. P04]|uniref:carbon-nitrogen hydrolase family protein n=1 Tax=Microbacterium sp. P04 TaxID=3366947 RepID=UPI003745C663
MSDRSVGVGVAQFAPVASVAANLDTIRDLAVTARSRGADVVLYPEYSSYFVDPFDESLADHAESIDGAFVASLAQIAADTGTTLVAGLLEKGDDGKRVRNTVVAVNGDGTLAVYRKLHLYDAFGQRESDWVEAGEIEPPQTFEVGGMRFALMTCYDLRFPEVARTLADAGADVVLVAADWVRGPLKEHHWQTLLQARAIENTVFVAGADHPPPLGVGHSLIADPQGVVLVTVGTTTDVAVAHLDVEAVARVRRVNPALELRRFRVVPI